MIETEKQRRWLFATHPEYSWSRKGTSTARHDSENNEPEKVSPEAVDAYVDTALQYVTGPVAALLKSLKRNFGTQAADNQHDLQFTFDPDVDALTRTTPYAGQSDRGLPTAAEEALVSDPHTFLDVAPYGRFITSPVQSVKALLRDMARDAVLNAAKKRASQSQFGDDISRTPQVRATISRRKHPEAARHVEDAQAAGQPSELTIDRFGARARGREALRDYPVKPGKDRDEYPPRMFEEGGRGASVRPISPSDNRSTGASMGNHLRKHPDGTKVKIEVVD